MKLESITKNLQLIRENPQGHFALKEDQETLEVVRGTDQKTEQAVLQVFQEAQAIEQETKKPLRVQGTSCAEEIWVLWQKHHGSEDRLEFIPIKVELVIEGQVFKLDRDLLTQSSEFMRALLEGEFKETNSTTLSPKFVSDLIKVDTVEQALHFFETGSLKENLNVDALLSLWCLAEEWDAPNLRKAIAETLASMVPVDDDLDHFRNLVDYPGDLPTALFLAIDGSQAVGYLSSLRQQISNSPTPDEDRDVKERIESMLLEVINTNQVPLTKIPGIHTAQNALDWLQTFSTDQQKRLFYADFTGLKDFDNPMLDLLTKSCPHLKYLVIPESKISSDALKHLKQIEGLQSLNIWWCEQLEADALKHLKQVKGLQSLNIGGCCQLEKDALKHLDQVKGLQSLNIRGCTQLEADALEHLKQVPRLQSLNISGCRQLEKDALKHLDQVKGLQSLDICCCDQLEADALKHLEQVPGLQSLYIEWCKQLAKDALKHLDQVKGLQRLNISACTQLEADALKHLEQVKGLQSLDIEGCTQLEKDALKHLKHVPGLQSLILWDCTQLEEDALKHLKQVKGLQSLDISACTQLEKDALKHLEQVPQLRSLNLFKCTQLEKDALKHLKQVKRLRRLNLFKCAQLEEDALKHLDQVKGLRNLNIAYCTQLEKDALKHLKHVPRLQSLGIAACRQLIESVAPDFVKRLIPK